MVVLLLGVITIELLLYSIAVKWILFCTDGSDGASSTFMWLHLSTVVSGHIRAVTVVDTMLQAVISD